jgi:serine/threonine protein phosphatase 1
VPLGDYIDRGPDSRGVIEQLMHLSAECQLVPILGNHEEMVFAAPETQSDLLFWLKFGGQSTLDSYGALGPRDIPSDHIQFLRSCKNFYETANHIFTHGYYEPGRPMTEQSGRDLRWTALPVQPVPHSSGKIAVVGHTPQRNGEVLDLRFLKCIDTYCHAGGWLTALDVTTGQIWQADREGTLRVG